MGAIQIVPAATRRQGRRWRFASVVLDEESWTLSVDDTRVPIEPKPLELLHELLLHAGRVVTKDQLLDAVWPGISVVEESLPTAIGKLRRALGNEKGDGAIIETVPRIGYRLAVAVECSNDPASHAGLSEAIGIVPVPTPNNGRKRRWLVTGGLVCILAAGIFAGVRALHSPPANAALAFTQRDAATAIRRLDVEKIETLLRGGWNPNAPVDKEGNGAMTFVLNICEWDPGHDRKRMLLMARTLFDGGARIDIRNKWGDTPYSIAKAKRYCGPDHPVTRMLHALCYSGQKRTVDTCLASYEKGAR